jgi:hypothetical protein
MVRRLSPFTAALACSVALLTSPHGVGLQNGAMGPNDSREEPSENFHYMHVDMAKAVAESHAFARTLAVMFAGSAAALSALGDRQADCVTVLCGGAKLAFGAGIRGQGQELMSPSSP